MNSTLCVNVVASVIAKSVLLIVISTDNFLGSEEGASSAEWGGGCLF